MAKDLLKDITIRNAKPTDKDQRLTDGGGLYLLIKPNGSKWWRFDYTIGGSRKTLSFGVYPTIGLSAARNQRHEAQQHIAQGIDPSTLRKSEKSQQTAQAEKEHCIAHGIPIKGTFEAIAREWLAIKYSKEVVRVTLLKTTRKLELHVFPPLGAMPIEAIKSADILSAIKAIAEHDKIETAHRLRTLSQVCQAQK